jgi:hypothetical protein
VWFRKLVNEEALTHWGLSGQKKKKKKRKDV